VRRLAVLSTAAAAVVSSASCADADRPPVEACDGATAASPGTATAAPTKPLLGMLMLPDTAVILAHLDPLTLEPRSRRVEVGEYHEAWSLSPDRSHVALGISSPGRRARSGIMIVDLEAMKVVRAVDTGVFAAALAWLAPRRLVAGLGRAFVTRGQAPPGGTVLVDPHTGKILRRWADLSDPQASARTGDGLVMLFPGPPTATPEATAAARLAVVDARGRVRSVTLERIRLAFRDGVQWDEAGLAVDPARARAYVFAAEAPAAEIDLRTMRVSYHHVEALLEAPRELNESEPQPSGALNWRFRRALWLGDGRILVFGSDFIATGGEELAAIAAGATLVDTRTWSACVLDERGGGAALVAGKVLVYGRGDPASGGLRAYTTRGSQAFRLLDRDDVAHVQAAGRLAYVRTRTAVYVVDVTSGKVVTRVSPRRDLVDVVAGAS
jgi:hypothetical protein